MDVGFYNTSERDLGAIDQVDKFDLCRVELSRQLVLIAVPVPNAQRDINLRLVKPRRRP